MGEEIAFENGQISNFQGLVTLTLDRVILHTVMHQSSTSTYTPNFTEIKESFCGWTDGHLKPTLGLLGVDLKIGVLVLDNQFSSFHNAMTTELTDEDSDQNYHAV